MNFHIGIHEQHRTTTCLEVMPTEQELLSQWGFSAEEIDSLLWLGQWYQTGGSAPSSFCGFLCGVANSNCSEACLRK